jgi:hypothetical protein
MSHPDPSSPTTSTAPSTRPPGEVDAHLRTCATCRGELGRWRAGRAQHRVSTNRRAGARRAPRSRRRAHGRRAQPRGHADDRPRPAAAHDPRVLAAAGAAALILLWSSSRQARPGHHPERRADRRGRGLEGGRLSTSQLRRDPARRLHVRRLARCRSQLRSAITASDGLENGHASSALGVGAPSAAAFRTRRTCRRTARSCPRDGVSEQGVRHPSGTLSRVIRARYGGQPAYSACI